MVESYILFRIFAKMWACLFILHDIIYCEERGKSHIWRKSKLDSFHNHRKVHCYHSHLMKLLKREKIPVKELQQQETNSHA